MRRRSQKQSRRSPRVGGVDPLINLQPIDIKKLFGLEENQVEEFFDELFETAIFVTTDKVRKLELFAYWCLLYTELGLGGSGRLIKYDEPKKGGVLGIGDAQAPPSTDIAVIEKKPMVTYLLDKITSIQQATITSLPQEYHAAVTQSFRGLNEKNGELVAKVQKIREKSKTGVLGAAATALLGLVAGLTAGANDIVNIVAPTAIQAEIAAAKASLVAGSLQGMVETGIDAAGQAAIGAALTLDTNLMEAIHKAVVDTPEALTAISVALKDMWGGIGTAVGTKGGQAATVVAEKIERGRLVLLARAANDIEVATATATEKLTNITSQTSTALALKSSGTETGTLGLQTFFNSIKRTPTDARSGFERTSDFFKVNWAWVSAYNAEKWTTYNMAQGHRLALQVLAVLSKNPTAISLVLLKLGLGAIAGLAVLPALNGYLKKLQADTELKLVEAEYQPQIQALQNEIAQLLDRLPRLKDAALAPPSNAAAAPATAGRRSTSRRRRPAAYLPRRTRRSSSGRRQRYSRRRRE